MGKISIFEVKSSSLEDEFIKLPWKIYEHDRYWVPPLISEFRNTIRGENNRLRQSGPYILILAYKDGQPSGRLCAGINENLNRAKGYSEGYISLFECVKDYEVAKAMFDYAAAWMKDLGMDKIIGPISLPSGDDNRGLLIDNFEDPPTVMNVYNPDYYSKFFEDYGFYKYWDCYAYYLDLTREVDERFNRVTRYAMEKYGFRVDMLDLKNIENDINDIEYIIERAMPDEWQDFIPPDDEEIKVIASNLVPVADPELIYIARANDGTPIGFDIALPDYNQALKHINGRLFPFGLFKFLYYKKRIDRVRLFVFFVVPEFRKKGVAAAIYIRAINAAREKGYKSGEGSTIWEYNTIMQRDVESVGGKIYKTYRIYKKDI